MLRIVLHTKNEYRVLLNSYSTSKQRLPLYPPEPYVTSVETETKIKTVVEDFFTCEKEFNDTGLTSIQNIAREPNCSTVLESKLLNRLNLLDKEITKKPPKAADLFLSQLMHYVNKPTK